MLTHLRHAKVTAKDLRRTASLLDAAYDQAAQIRIDDSMSDERINAILENLEFAAFARLCPLQSRSVWASSSLWSPAARMERKHAAKAGASVCHRPAANMLLR